MNKQDENYLAILVIVLSVLYIVLYFCGFPLSLHVKTFADAKHHPFWKIGGFCWLIEWIGCLIWPFSNFFASQTLLGIFRPDFVGPKSWS